jgi:hypothetical protein
MSNKIVQNLSTRSPRDWESASANVLVALTYPAAGQFAIMASEYLPINGIGIRDALFDLGRRSFPAGRRLLRVREEFAADPALRDGSIKRKRPTTPQIVGATEITADRVEKSC